MTLLLAASFFVLGAIFASFSGVVAERLNTGQSFLLGRSRCDACGTPLPPRSLVPILSYVLSRANASCCGVRISPISPIMELLLGASFALAYLRIGLVMALLPFLFALVVVCALVLYDLRHQILPFPLLTTFVFASALAGFLFAPSLPVFLSSLVSAFLIGGFLAAIHFLSRGRAMGLADAPFAFGLALLVGSAALSGFVFSFWIGAAIGIVLLFGRPRGSRMGVEVPFAPFLAAGFLLAYFTQWNLFLLVAAASLW